MMMVSKCRIPPAAEMRSRSRRANSPQRFAPRRSPIAITLKIAQSLIEDVSLRLARPLGFLQLAQPTKNLRPLVSRQPRQLRDDLCAGHAPLLTPHDARGKRTAAPLWCRLSACLPL